MNAKTILILGGYGNTGRLLVRLLLRESNANLVLAGRHLERAALVADELNRTFPGNRVRVVVADASSATSLQTAFSGADMVVVASSTTQYTPQVVEAALAARTDYFDIQYSAQKIAFLKAKAEAIQESGCCFITDGGFHPGLPAFLVRYASQYFDHLVSARVGSVIKEDWKHMQVDDATVNELAELINDFDMSIFNDGKWKKVGLFSTTDFISMDFGGQFGKQTCAPMMLEEMRSLPQVFPSLQNTGFYVGGFNGFTDWVIMPVAMVAMKLFPRAAVKPMGSWMHWGLNTFSSPPYGTLLQVEAEGKWKNKVKRVRITISHPDGYMFTAIPVAACLLQYLDGSIRKPGLWMQAHRVEPNRFMDDMQRMGISIQLIDGRQG